MTGIGGAMLNPGEKETLFKAFKTWEFHSDHVLLYMYGGFMLISKCGSDSTIYSLINAPREHYIFTIFFLNIVELLTVCLLIPLDIYGAWWFFFQYGCSVLWGGLIWGRNLTPLPCLKSRLFPYYKNSPSFKFYCSS